MRKQPTFAPIEAPPPLRPGEPYFLLRAQDKCSTYAVMAYRDGLIAKADELLRSLDAELVAIGQRLHLLATDVEAMHDYFVAWQIHHPDSVKFPD